MHTPLPSRHAPRFGLVVALLALGLTVLGGAPALAKPPRATPFVSIVSGTLTATGPSTFDLTGSGLSTLGRMGYAGHVQITNVDSDGVITDVLIETLTTANGDTLTLRCEQTATPVGPGVLHGVDEWTVVGGTGRFANATGSGTGSTDADLNVGTFSKIASGTIRLG